MDVSTSSLKSSRQATLIKYKYKVIEDPAINLTTAVKHNTNNE